MSIPLRRSARGTARQALTQARKRGARRLDFTEPYLNALYADAATLGIDTDVLVAQWDLETDAAKSEPPPSAIGPGRDRTAVTLSERQRRRRVMPGTYTVRLEAGGTTLERPIVVRAEGNDAVRGLPRR